MRPLTPGAALLVLSAALPLAAQSPAPHPSQKTGSIDSIYTLALAAPAHPNDEAVTLLDEGITHRNADGTGSRTMRQVIQVFTDGAARGMGQRPFPYTPGRQKLTVNWARVVRRDGSIVSATPAVDQDMEIPAFPMLGNTSRPSPKMHMLGVAGVQPGMIVDISVTIEDLTSAPGGDFIEMWNMNGMGSQVRRSHYAFDVPASLKPHISKSAEIPAPAVRTANGRTTYEWIITDPPAQQFEPFAPMTSMGSFIVIGAPITWDIVARQYADLTRGRYVVSPALTQAVHDVVQGEKTLDDSITAVHRWILKTVQINMAGGAMDPSQPIVAVAPQLPDSVFLFRSGTPDDRATLFLAILKQMHVTANPVLYGATFDSVFFAIPSRGTAPMTGVAVRTKSGYKYADFSGMQSRYGAPFIMAPVPGLPGVVVHLEDGHAEQVTMPGQSPLQLDSIDIVGTLDSTGNMTGHFREHGDGPYREMMEGFINNIGSDSMQRSFAIRGALERFFEDATGDSLVQDDHRGGGTSIHITHAAGATLSGGTMVVTLPRSNFMGRMQTEMLNQLVATPRKMPIDASMVIGVQGHTLVYQLALPPGWTPKLPPPVHLDTSFGRYDATYTMDGHTLTVRRALVGKTGIYPASQLNELVTFLKALTAADTRFIVLEHTVATTAR